MKEYVEKKLAIEACYDGYADCRDDCADNIRALPVCKVREVVTCGECLNCEKIDDYEWWCAGRGFPKVLTTKDDYCSHGRRKEENELGF